MSEKTVELGSVGQVEIDFTAGVAKVSISASVPGSVGVQGGAFVSCDAAQLITQIFAAIEAKLPASAVPIEETVKTIIINAVKAID